MILAVNKFGGLQPQTKDPLLLPEGKSQVAVNVRFDGGGVEPLETDALTVTPTHAGTIKSIFLYQAVNKFLAWLTDVTAVTAPLANDAYDRVFYTEGGKLKVTDSTKYADGGTDYPEKWLYPSPPAPPAALVATAYTEGFKLITYLTVATSFGMMVYTPSGTMAELVGYDAGTLIRLEGTGIAALDGKFFEFSNVAARGSSDVFYIPEVTTLVSMDIQGITQANPGVVTSVGHGLFNTDMVTFAIAGMLLAGRKTVTVIDDNSFSIGTDTTALDAFVGGWWSLSSRSYDTDVYPLIVITAAGGVVISKANPAKVTHTAHGLTNNTVLKFTVMVGMVELEGVQAQITVLDDDNFTLNDIDSTAYGTFVSGKYQGQATYNRALDPLLERTIFYTETFVNSYGSEGPPAPASNLVDMFDGDPVTLADTNITVDAAYGVVSKNIYRSNTDASGNEVLQLLVNIPLATAAYTDEITSANLAEVLQSTLWDGPIDGVEGLVALANETMAAFSGNTVLFSEPLYPHAWPYQFPTDTPVMGLGAFGTSVLVLTQGIPYLISGNTPSDYIMDKMGVGFGCVSKTSVVQVGDAVMYAGTDGLVAMSTNSAVILTAKIVLPKQWREDFAPTTIRAYFWEGKYIGFYDNGTPGGFCYDAKEGELVKLDFYATAGYHDPVSGSLYLMVGANIVAFARGDDLRTASLKTKRYRFDLASFGVVKIIAQTYPVTITVTYYGAATTVVELTATSREFFRHPDVGLVDECDITINSAVTAIYLAGSPEELPL